MGIFDVSGSQIEALDAAGFTRLVNALLHAERAAQGLPLDAVSITSRINDPDQGIDAHFCGSVGSQFIAPGESVWQFKRRKQGQEETKTEAKKPGPARVLASGGHYYLALAEDVTRVVLKTRLDWLGEVAADPERVHVYNGSAIAQWANRYPAVVAALGLAEPLRGLRSHAQWREFHRRPTYVPSRQQQRLGERWISALLETPAEHLRLEGPGGCGKTRAVLEALAHERLAPLVVYAQCEQELSLECLDYFTDNALPVIAVVDECTRRRHTQLAARIPDGSPVTLITVGDASAPPTPDSFAQRLDAMESTELRQVIGENYFPHLNAARIALAADNAGGSVALARTFAERMLTMDGAELATMTEHGDITGVLRLALPEGVAFTVATYLALPQRVGFDGELAADGHALAEFSGISHIAFNDAVADLTARGLATRQGRYRSITPAPLAIYLAARAWSERTSDIVEHLLPALSARGRESLLARAAELGQFPPASQALSLILAPHGPFASVATLEETGAGTLLRYLAVTDPRATIATLETMTSAPSDQLRQARRSRRDVMWALEKCVWHSALFERGADILLRLALAENETSASSATGVWSDLFMSRLPATAASPQARLAYLTKLAATTDDPGVRTLIVDAVAHGVAVHEIRASSGERQHGHLPESAGATLTQEENVHYRGELFTLLRALAEVDPAVMDRAREIILTVFRSYLGSFLEPLGIDQIEWLADHDARAVRLASHYWITYKAHDNPSTSGWARIEALLARIAPHDPWARLLDLAQHKPWTHQGTLTSQDEIIARFTEPVRALRTELTLAGLLDRLSPLEFPSAHFVGHALACTRADPIAEFLTILGHTGPSMADLRRGYLSALDRPETTAARDAALVTALDQDLLTAAEAIGYWLELQPTPLGQSRVTAAVRAREVTVDQIARPLVLSAWLRQLQTAEFVTYYDALLDNKHATGSATPLLFLLRNHLHHHPGGADELGERMREALLAYPLGGHEPYEWAEACLSLLPAAAQALAQKIIKAAADGTIHLDQVSNEARVFNACMRAEPGPVWQAFADAAHGGELLFRFGARSWLDPTPAYDAIIGWIEDADSGERLERARLTAAVIPVHDSPTPLAAYLLNSYADATIDEELAAGFTTGFFWGPGTHHVGAKLENLKAWEHAGTGARRWASLVAAGLRQRLAQVERAEAEGRL